MHGIFVPRQANVSTMSARDRGRKKYPSKTLLTTGEKAPRLNVKGRKIRIPTALFSAGPEIYSAACGNLPSHRATRRIRLPTRLMNVGVFACVHWICWDVPKLGQFRSALGKASCVNCWTAGALRYILEKTVLLFRSCNDRFVSKLNLIQI